MSISRGKLWAVIAAIVVQVLIVAAVPARQVYTRLTGVEVVLQTEPLDPYSIMSGYYVTVGYPFSNLSDEFGKLPNDSPLYVTLAPPAGDANSPAWKALAVQASRPASIPAGCVVLKGQKEDWRIRYGIESYYMPEEERDEINSALAQNRSRALMDVKIDSFGHAAILRLRINGKVYEY